MAVESAQQIEQIDEVPVKRWKFTVDDYYRMGELGIFPPDARVQLIDGEVYRMPPIGPDHAGSVDEFGDSLRDRLGSSVIVRRQNPIRLRPGSEPEPDLALVRPRSDYYRRSHPTAKDVILVIEVADSTLTFDRVQKAAMYAQAGIAEYWIVDLVDRQLLVHREPRDGAYQLVEARSREQTVTPLAFPDLAIAIADILG